MRFPPVTGHRRPSDLRLDLRRGDSVPSVDSGPVRRRMAYKVLEERLRWRLKYNQARPVRSKRSVRFGRDVMGCLFLDQS